jgi:hypothetical protein
MQVRSNSGQKKFDHKFRTPTPLGYLDLNLFSKSKCTINIYTKDEAGQLLTTSTGVLATDSWNEESSTELENSRGSIGL